jgi:hypothetical protein
MKVMGTTYTEIKGRRLVQIHCLLAHALLLLLSLLFLLLWLLFCFAFVLAVSRWERDFLLSRPPSRSSIHKTPRNQNLLVSMTVCQQSVGPATFLRHKATTWPRTSYSRRITKALFYLKRMAKPLAVSARSTSTFSISL